MTRRLRRPPRTIRVSAPSRRRVPTANRRQMTGCHRPTAVHRRKNAAAVAASRRRASPAAEAAEKARPMRPEVQACVALGANLGDAVQSLRDALAALDAHPAVRVLRTSSFYRTAPVEASGPDFINAVALVATTLTAPGLLAVLQDIEQAAGRLRPYR